MELFGMRHSGRKMIVAGSILASIVLSACGSANGNTTTSSASTGANNGKGCMKVGVLLPETASSARWDSKDRPALTNGIKSALGSGATVDYANAEGNADTQQTQAEADIAKGDCILVVGPSDGQKAAAIVAKAKAKNIPVIAYDRLIYSDDLNYYVSFDNEGVGKLQGQYVVDHYKDFTKDSTNLVMINGAQTDNNALLFQKGAQSALQPLIDSKSLNLVYHTFTDQWDNAKAQTEMEGALSANGNKVGVAYVANDGMANSVIAALKAHNLNGKVLVTGQDATVAGIQNILLGDQTMTVYKDISKEANATISLVSALSKGDSTSSLTSGNTVKNPSGKCIDPIYP